MPRPPGDTPVHSAASGKSKQACCLPKLGSYFQQLSFLSSTVSKDKGSGYTADQGQETGQARKETETWHADHKGGEALLEPGPVGAQCRLPDLMAALRAIIP